MKRARLINGMYWLNRVVIVGIFFFSSFSVVFAQTGTFIDTNEPPELQLEGGGNIVGDIYSQLKGVAGDTYAVDAVGVSPILRVISAIVSVVAGILGVIAVILIIYAGFLWLTAGGNEDNISKAKMILKQVVIGIVLLAVIYSLANFVISLVSTETPTDQKAVTGDKTGSVIK